MRLLPILAGIWLCLAPVSAQTPDAPAPTALPRVALDTTEGRIVVEVDTAHAPITAANFLAYVARKRFDGTGFYRSMPFGASGGLVQGGTRNDPARILPPIKHEPTDVTGLTHDDGALSMARNAPGTATGDFFIILGDAMKGLDADPAASGDNAGFAVFGHVIEGMDVVRRIHANPKSPTEGQGVMKGQMLAAPVKIVTARRIP